MFEHEPAKVGVYLGAVRVIGRLAFEIVDALLAATGNAPGAIVGDPGPHGVVHFLTEPGAGEGLRWPPGVKRLDGQAGDFVKVPAWTGNTLPVSWLARPTRDSVFVDAHVLHRVACAVTRYGVLRTDEEA
ncbi:hypothetical protein [Streptomyces sp. NPDC054863]